MLDAEDQTFFQKNPKELFPSFPTTFVLTCLVHLAQGLELNSPTRHELWHKVIRPETITKDDFVDHFMHIRDARFIKMVEKSLVLHPLNLIHTKIF